MPLPGQFRGGSRRRPRDRDGRCNAGGRSGGLPCCAAAGATLGLRPYERSNHACRTDLALEKVVGAVGADDGLGWGTGAVSWFDDEGMLALFDFIVVIVGAG